jgi:oligopeptide transport system permease protein
MNSAPVKAPIDSDSPAGIPLQKLQQRTLWQDALRRYLRNRLAIVGSVILLFLVAVALLADLIAPYNFDRVFFTIRHPVLPFVDPDHLLGTDAAGRDYLSRLVYGSRTSLVIGLVAASIAFLIGVPLGALAGYMGGWVDFVVQRVIEVGTGIPGLIFALLLLAVTGPSVQNLIFVLSITAWIESARITRGQFLALRSREYITAARALGATASQIILRHILPNAFSPLLIAFSLAVPQFIFAEAGLSFLGLGITEPTPSWGKMVGGSVGTTVRVFWHLALFPTMMIALTLLGFSFVADGLQEALDITRAE